MRVDVLILAAMLSFLGYRGAVAAESAPSSAQPTERQVRFSAQGMVLPSVPANKRMGEGVNKSRPLPASIIKVVPRGVVPLTKNALSSPMAAVFDVTIEIPAEPSLDLSGLRVVPSSGEFRPSKASGGWKLNAASDTASIRGIIVLMTPSQDVWVSVQHHGATDLAVSHVRVAIPEKLAVSHDGPLENPDGTVTVVFRAKATDQDGSPMPGIPVLFLTAVPDADQQKTWLLTDPSGEACVPVTSEPKGQARSQVFVSMLKPLTSSTIAADLSEDVTAEDAVSPVGH